MKPLKFSTMTPCFLLHSFITPNSPSDGPISAAKAIFEFDGDIPDNTLDCRKLMYLIFDKFTRSHFKIVKSINKYAHKLSCSISDTVNIIQFTHDIMYNNIDINHTNQYITPTHPLYHPHSYSPVIHFSPPLLPCSAVAPFPYPDSNPVGVRLQYAVYKGVMENLLACGFSMSSGKELNKNIADSPDKSMFRNLFFPCPEEIEEFERLLKDDIYELLMKAIGTDMDRDEFKEEFFHFLYRPAFSRHDKIEHWQEDRKLIEKREEPVRKSFEALLPSIVLFLDICKCRPGTLDRYGEDYKWTSRAMISIESQIMLECCANLWNKYPKMFLTTVHDCIKCLPQDVEKVKVELKRTFEKYYVSPKFEVKQHRVPSDFNG